MPKLKILIADGTPAVKKRSPLEGSQELMCAMSWPVELFE